MTTKSARKSSRDNSKHGESRIASVHRNSQTTSVPADSRINSVRIASLRRLPDDDLLAGLLATRGTERAAQVAVVKYLVEVERRKLYLPRGYGSLFEFCTDYLKYSRSSAGRRISVARCIGRFPRVAELFERGECDLSVISIISGVMTKENCTEIAQWLRGRSLREVEAFAARRQPGRAVRDQVRQIYVMSVKQNSKAVADPVPSNESPTPAEAPRNGTEPPEPDAGSRTDIALRNGTAPAVVDAAHCTEPTPRNGTAIPSSGAPNAEPSGGAECTVHRTFTPSAGSKTAQGLNNKQVKNCGLRICSGGDSSDAPAPVEDAPADRSVENAPTERMVVELKFKIQFAVEPAFMEKLNKIKSMLSTKYPKKVNFEMIFDILMSEYLDRHSPEEKIKRRNARRGRKERKNKKLDNKKDNPDTRNKKSSRNTNIPRKNMKRTRHVPQTLRDEVFKRDGGRCTFVGDDGTRCNSDWNIQIDHIIPYAKGGDNSPENLRLLCAEHNKLEAERAFGTNHMKKFYRRE